MSDGLGGASIGDGFNRVRRRGVQGVWAVLPIIVRVWVRSFVGVLEL
jgi:hypothetical protein